MSQRTSTRFIILAASAAVIAAPAVMAQNKDYAREKAAKADALSERKAPARAKLQKRPDRAETQKARKEFPGDIFEAERQKAFPGDTFDAERKKKEFPGDALDPEREKFPGDTFDAERTTDYPDSVFKKDQARIPKDPR